ncbi:MAG: hypothetical protein JNK48_19120 [Bryobacterales bacterium]|nr:hypothetical protein [Bryobacterales bacterium]
MIGNNGSGKSTVFDALGFLRDMLVLGVEHPRRGPQTPHGRCATPSQLHRRQHRQYLRIHASRAPPKGYKAYSSALPNASPASAASIPRKLPEEVWIIEKGADGFAQVRRASDDPVVRNMAAEGISLGSLWCGDYFDN